MNQSAKTEKKGLIQQFKEAPVAVRAFFALIVVAVACSLLFAGEASAVSASGATLHTFFYQMWDEVKGLMTGAPAKAIMGLSILGTIAFSMIKPNLIGFLASVVIILVLANAPTTIDGSLTVTVEALKAGLVH